MPLHAGREHLLLSLKNMRTFCFACPLRCVCVVYSMRASFSSPSQPRLSLTQSQLTINNNQSPTPFSLSFPLCAVTDGTFRFSDNDDAIDSSDGHPERFVGTAIDALSQCYPVGRRAQVCVFVTGAPWGPGDEREWWFLVVGGVCLVDAVEGSGGMIGIHSFVRALIRSLVALLLYISFDTHFLGQCGRSRAPRRCRRTWRGRRSGELLCCSALIFVCLYYAHVEQQQPTAPRFFYKFPNKHMRTQYQTYIHKCE